MGAALTVQNAEIKTAAVEVKTLTISGKQVTLAVFRQLREESLIAEGGTFNGTPWGVVNYHPDKCADASEHLHVVWQQGTDLRRAAVRQPAWVAGHRGVVDAAHGEEWLDLAVLDGWRPSSKRPAGVTSRGGYTFRVTFDAGTLVVFADEVVLDVIWPRLFFTYASDEDEREIAARQACRDKAMIALRERVTSTSRAEVVAQVESEIAAVVALRRNHEARWKEINDLPQLFIAV